MRVQLRSVASAATLVASTVVAMRGVPRWDGSVFTSVNSLPSFLQYPLWAPMQVGSLGGVLATGAFAGLRRDRELGVDIAVSGTAAWLLAKGLKRGVGRERPASRIDGAALRIGAADTGLGFPSGHAAVAATIVVSLGSAASPATRMALVGLAAVVGVSRTYVGAHYPLDVIGGWALGVVAADASACVISSLRRIQEGQGDSGSLIDG